MFKGSKCPKGYLELEGTYAGNTLGEMEKNVTVRQCAEMCDEELLCHAFEYNVGSKKCKLNHDPNPNRGKYGKFFFCQKESKKEVLYVMYYIPREIY